MKKIKAKIKIRGGLIGKRIKVSKKTRIVNKLRREEIEDKILIFVENHKEQYIGLTPYKRLYSDLTKHYGERQITFKSMEEALKELDKKGILKLVIIDKKFKVVQFAPIERGEGIKQIIKLAIKKNGKITTSDIINDLGLNLKTTNQIMTILQEQKLAIETNDDIIGKCYYFPDLFN